MQAAVLILSPHRRTRLIACVRLALLWVAGVLFGALNPQRRHTQQRHDWLSLDRLTRAICMLAIVRGAELVRASRRRAQTLIAAPPGFRRRDVKNRRRAMTGAHLRRWFKHKHVGVRITRALEALADLDAFARRHVLKRAQRGLTKLYALVPVHPAVAAFVSATPRAPSATDSS